MNLKGGMDKFGAAQSRHKSLRAYFEVLGVLGLNDRSPGIGDRVINAKSLSINGKAFDNN